MEMSTQPPRLPVPLTNAELAEIDALAKQAGVSPSTLGLSIIEHMLAQARTGALPMVPDCERYDDTPQIPPSRLLAPPSRIVARVGANKNPAPRLDIQMNRVDLTEMANLARQANTSPAVLGQVFIRQLLGQVHSGSLEMSKTPQQPSPSPVADAS